MSKSKVPMQLIKISPKSPQMTNTAFEDVCLKIEQEIATAYANTIAGEDDHERMDEITVYRNGPFKLEVIVPSSLSIPVQKAAGRSCNAAIADKDYHRTPFGYICEQLTADGWKFIGKFKGDAASEFRMYEKGGLKRILHHPSFVLYQLVRVDTEHLKRK